MPGVGEPGDGGAHAGRERLLALGAMAMNIEAMAGQKVIRRETVIAFGAPVELWRATVAAGHRAVKAVAVARSRGDL